MFSAVSVPEMMASDMNNIDSAESHDLRSTQRLRCTVFFCFVYCTAVLERDEIAAFLLPDRDPSTDSSFGESDSIPKYSIK